MAALLRSGEHSPEESVLLNASLNSTPVLSNAIHEDELNGARPSLSSLSGLRQRRSLFSATTDVRTPEHVQRLISTIETLRDESGDNVHKLRVWVQQQQKELQSWLKKQQPLQVRVRVRVRVKVRVSSRNSSPCR